MTTPDDSRPKSRLGPALLGVWTAGVLILATITLAPPFLPIYVYLGHGLFLDNILHFLVFACTAALTPFTFEKAAVYSFALAVLLLLAFVLEGLQFFIPGHRADAVDFIAGAIGLALGAAAGILAKRVSDRRAASRDKFSPSSIADSQTRI